jgi:glycosyltransferase involved in cell wall biosynthesis
MSEPGGRAMRILEIETFGRGGLVHYAHNLSSALAGRGHDVTLLTSAAYELEGRPRPEGVRLVKGIARFTSGRGRALPGPLLAWARRVEAVRDAFAVTAVARRERPDVVHLHCTNPASAVYLTLLRRAGVPLVATAHVVTPHEPIPLQHAVYRQVHHAPDLVVAHSEFDRRRLVDEFSVPPGRVVVIPHGEYGFFASDDRPARDEARRALGLSPQDEVALFFGYVREYKGLDLLLDAWPAVREARPRARLVVAGDPVRLPASRRRALEEQARRLGAVVRLEFVPFADVARYFAAADALALPYRHVSQSGVLYLALALGLPVVATRVGALPELLHDGESALLVPPESPGDLAAALVRLLGDPTLRERLARGGRRIAEEHSWPAVAERTEAAFARLVGR